jgi:hypothetical protein
MMITIGYSIKVLELNEINYQEVYNILDDVLSLYLADNYKVNAFDSTMVVTASEIVVTGAGSPLVSSTSKPKKPISKRQVKKTSPYDDARKQASGKRMNKNPGKPLRDKNGKFVSNKRVAKCAKKRR